MQGVDSPFGAFGLGDVIRCLDAAEASARVELARVGGLLTPSKLAEARASFLHLETPIKVRLLLSLLSVRRDEAAGKNEVDALLQLADKDSEEWVKVSAGIVKQFVVLQRDGQPNDSYLHAQLQATASKVVQAVAAPLKSDQQQLVAGGRGGRVACEEAAASAADGATGGLICSFDGVDEVDTGGETSCGQEEELDGAFVRDPTEGRCWTLQATEESNWRQGEGEGKGQGERKGEERSAAAVNAGENAGAVDGSAAPAVVNEEHAAIAADIFAMHQQPGPDEAMQQYSQQQLQAEDDTEAADEVVSQQNQQIQEHQQIQQQQLQPPTYQDLYRTQQQMQMHHLAPPQQQYHQGFEPEDASINTTNTTGMPMGFGGYNYGSTAGYYGDQFGNYGNAFASAGYANAAMGQQDNSMGLPPLGGRQLGFDPTQQQQQHQQQNNGGYMGGSGEYWR
ncbi:Negative elongation factor A [Phytophthora cactorum]|nr:Negative elongation factor A [Phytophthora cactorum]